MKIYGPYTRKNGRKHIITIEEGKRKTTSYPKWLLEQHIGRKLVGDETTDHINGDFRDDSLSNLQILSRIANAEKSAKKGRKISTLVCKHCNKTFERFTSQVRNNRDGPFCSKRCVGKVHH